MEIMFVVFFFFFQAEDGIRDGTVTGVQTCALPISFASSKRSVVLPTWRGPESNWIRPGASSANRWRSSARQSVRSEEHTSELQSQFQLVCRLLLEKKKSENNSVCNYWTMRLDLATG